MSEINFPTTQGELDALLQTAEEKGAELSNEQNAKMISDLEAKLSLVENNPLSFPRILDKDDNVHELPYVNTILVPVEGSATEYKPEHFINDEAAILKFSKSAEDVLADLFENHPGLFIKK